MDWEARLRREGIVQRFPRHTLVYHLGLRPPVPPEYAVAGLVGVTFRLGDRPDGAPLYATLLDVAAVLRLGARLGLDEGQAVAMVDSHERVHVAVQLAYPDVRAVPPEVEEAHVHVVDAAWLALRHEEISPGEVVAEKM
ncbi:MAG: hypothetical protein QOE90_727 [Thermoplasmata archaeon]|jgi:hypothetical protein|nr:hypothetical protein [Thermoplasmata archaeon]